MGGWGGGGGGERDVVERDIQTDRQTETETVIP